MAEYTIKPLTVSEVIEKLQLMDGDLPVYLTEPKDAYKSALQPVVDIIVGNVWHKGVEKEKCIQISW